MSQQSESTTVVADRTPSRRDWRESYSARLVSTDLLVLIW